MKFSKSFDKLAAFDKVVAPLIEQLWDVCKENGIPLVILAQGSGEADPGGGGFKTHVFSSATLGEGDLMVDYGLMFASMLSNSVISQIAQSVMEDLLRLEQISSIIDGTKNVKAVDATDKNLASLLFGLGVKEGEDDDGQTPEDC